MESNDQAVWQAARVINIFAYFTNIIGVTNTPKRKNNNNNNKNELSLLNLRLVNSHWRCGTWSSWFGLRWLFTRYAIRIEQRCWSGLTDDACTAFSNTLEQTNYPATSLFFQDFFSHDQNINEIRRVYDVA